MPGIVRDMIFQDIYHRVCFKAKLESPPSITCKDIITQMALIVWYYDKVSVEKKNSTKGECWKIRFYFICNW